LRIQITGTYDECEVAADRIARIFTVRRVPRPSARDDGLYQVRLDAQLRQQDVPDSQPSPSARRVGGPPPPRRRPWREP
jgi:hypothetical protein